MTRIISITALVLALALASASAQNLRGIINGFTGGGTITPPSCDGSIDLSKGCAQPMLGGL